MSYEDNRSSQEVGTDLEQPVEVSTLTSGTPESSEMSNLLAGMETLSAVPLVPGEVVQGKVLKVADGEVVVDLGLKTEATAPFAEFLNSEGQVSVAPGDTVDIWIEQYDEVTGRVEISHQKAVRRKVWEDIERAFQEQTTITGRVLDRIKGGLTVDVGVPAFLPASHADVRAHGNVDELKGQEITCKIIKINRKRNNVVVSRKLALEEELNRRKGELAERLVEGAEVVGKVKNLADYGVFRGPGGNGRTPAYYRSRLGAREPPLGGRAGRPGNPRQSSEARCRKGARFAWPEAAYAGPLGDGAAHISCG